MKNQYHDLIEQNRGMMDKRYHNMMLGSKAFDPLMLTDFFAFHAHKILKDSKSAHFSAKNGYFLMFCGSQGHLFSCKQENR